MRRDKLVGLVASMLLGALTVGLPTALLKLGADVVGPGALDSLPYRLTSPDDGSLLLLVVLVVAWLAWAMFTCSVVLEIVAVIRGLPTPRLPGLGGMQRGAAGLLAGATLVLSSPASSVHAPTARPLVATAASSPALVARVDAESAPVAKPPASLGPVVTVQRHDTLWSLAERHLRSGDRFREIVRLNRGVVQPDGRSLSDAQWIYPGWQLRLPADADHVGNSPGNEYVVKAGDSLSEIAEHELGNATRAQELFSLNEGKPQEQRGALVDPDLLQPGWHLTLPASVQASGTAYQADGTRTPELPPAADRPTWDEGTGSPVVEPQEPATRDAQVPVDGSGSDVIENRLVAEFGLGVLAATGLMLELRRRRRQQQRFRRPGRRIPMPVAAAAAMERTAAVLAEPMTVELTLSALRSMAQECRRLERALPDVLAVRVSKDSVRLQLHGEELDAVRPFAVDGNGMWRLKDSPTQCDASDPYPALLSLGVDGDEMLLVNLESVGTLSVVDPIGDVWRAAMAELRLGPFLQSSTVTEATQFSLFASAAPERIRSVRDPGQLDRELSSRLASGQELLGNTGNLRHARAFGVPGEGLLPEIYVLEEEATASQAPAWSGACLLSLRAERVEGVNLVVNGDGTAELVPLGMAFAPNVLPLEGLEHLTSLLATASEGATEPVSAEQETDVSAVSEALPDVPVATLDLRDAVDAPPRLRVLGRVEVENANDAAAPSRRRRATELVAFLMLHPGATGPELDEALWPGKRIEKTSRNPFISRARQWLGRGSDGQPYLPLVAEGGSYRLRGEVTCDWHDFVRFAQLGLDSGPQGLTALSAALDLVRGRPFLGVDPANYSWAEADAQDMISAVVDVAHVLAEAHLQAGDNLRARQAVAKGLLAEPCSEMLFRDAMRAALAAGDVEELERLTARLRHEIQLLDPDESVDDETVELLSAR